MVSTAGIGARMISIAARATMVMVMPMVATTDEERDDKRRSEDNCFFHVTIIANMTLSVNW